MAAGRPMLLSMVRMPLLFLLIAVVSFAEFRAGAAKRKITPDLRSAPVFLAGFSPNRPATGVHDDLWVRCVAMKADTTLVICGVDSIGLFFDDVGKIRERAGAKLSAPAHIIVAATHNHETPDTMGLWGPGLGKSGIDEPYNELIIERASEAVVDAVNSMQPATARFGKVRNAELDGFIDDTRPPVVLDTELIAVALDGARGGRIATLVNWANHPETLGEKNTLVTADYLASFYTRLESSAGGVAVFVNGAVGGMMSPLGAKVAGAPGETFERAEIIGTRVAELAHAAAKSGKRAAIDRIEHGERVLEIPVANKLFLMAAQAGVFKGRKAMTNGTTQAPLGFFRLSGAKAPVLECALVPGELYPELSVGGVERYEGADYPDAPVEPAMKQMMTAPYRMLIGLANDEIGYIIPKAEWDERQPWLRNAPKRLYGEINSVGPETAPIITKAMRELLGGQNGRASN